MYVVAESDLELREGGGGVGGGVGLLFALPASVPSAIGHFRITFSLFFKPSLGAHPFI